MLLPTASSPRSIVCSVLRFGLRGGSVRRADVRFVETITVTVCTLTAIDSVQKSTVLLGFSALSVLRILLLIVSLLELHGTNIINCWGGGT